MISVEINGMGIQVKETKPNNFVGYVAKFILIYLKEFHATENKYVH